MLMLYIVQSTFVQTYDAVFDSLSLFSSYFPLIDFYMNLNLTTLKIYTNDCVQTHMNTTSSTNTTSIR